MNLLLLLSALLSALTGAATGTRAPQLAVAVATTTQVAAESAISARATQVPEQTSAERRVELNVDGANWPLTPLAPLFLSRRRE